MLLWFPQNHSRQSIIDLANGPAGAVVANCVGMFKVHVVRGGWYDDEATFAMKQPLLDVWLVVVNQDLSVDLALCLRHVNHAILQFRTATDAIEFLSPGMTFLMGAFSEDLHLKAKFLAGPENIPPQLEPWQITPPADLGFDEVHADFQPRMFILC